MKKFKYGATAVALVAVTAFYGARSWDYYQENHNVMDQENWVTFGLLTAGVVLVGLGLLFVQRDKNVGGIVSAVTGSVLFALVMVYRYEAVTLGLALILILGLMQLIVAVVLVLDALADSPTGTPKKSPKTAAHSAGLIGDDADSPFVGR